MASERPCVLVVDDDDMVCVLLTEVLSRAGFAIERAADGREGLERFHAVQPDIVLLDVIMPEVEGFECLTRMRSQSVRTLLPIVMLTALDDIESIDRAFALGATDFIAKPIHWPTLAHRLHYLMRATETMRRLTRSESDLRSAQTAARLGNWELEAGSERLHCSPVVNDVLGLEAEAPGPALEVVLERVAPSEAAAVREAFEQCRARGLPFSIDFRARLPDGRERVIHAQGAPAEAAPGAGPPRAIHGLIQDITEFRRIEDRVHFLSHYDAATGLPNLTQFRETLRKSIAAAQRQRARVGVLFVGVERIGRVAEAWGRVAADQLLQQFAERLGGVVRQCDELARTRDGSQGDAALARLSDTEFGVIANLIHDARDAGKVAQRIIEASRGAFRIEDHEVFLPVSVGISTYPEDGADVEALIKNGEVAMSHAREVGHNEYQFFNRSLNAEAFRRLMMENHLRRAIERGEFTLHYQPQYDVDSGRIAALEALIRWNHPEMGLIPPVQFVALAEEMGLIGRIGEWVVEETCRQSREWQDGGMAPVPVAINVSAVQFVEPGLRVRIRNALARHRIQPQLLVIEVTESILMGDLNGVLEAARALEAMGVEISLDDFGTGYSSLSYLSRIPIDELKIDRSFVMRMTQYREDATIVNTIIGLAKSLGLRIVAEGVETVEQADFLRANGCGRMQGFLYGKPVPAAQILAEVAAASRERGPRWPSARAAAG